MLGIELQQLQADFVVNPVRLSLLQLASILTLCPSSRSFPLLLNRIAALSAPALHVQASQHQLKGTHSKLGDISAHASGSLGSPASSIRLGGLLSFPCKP